MKILRASKKAVPPPPQVAELITTLLNTSTDDLPQVLSPIDVWKWPRSDLNAWIKVLNKFDAVLEEIIRDYGVEKLQVNVFTPATKKTVCAILRFERLLLENSTNRKMFNSYDRLNALLFCSDLDVVILALNVLLRPAQQYSAQASVSHALSISTPRLQSLAKRWPHLREYGISLVDLVQENGNSDVDGLPTETREITFSFYKTETAANGEKEKDKKMETDVFDASQSSPRKVPAPPTTSSSGAINIHIDEHQIASKSVMGVLADTIEEYSVPDDEKFELMCRIRAAKALFKGQEADRIKLVIIRLLAIAIFGHTHPESQATTSLFLYEPDVIAHIAELLQIDHEIPIRVQTAAIAALDSLARYRNKNQEVLTAINAGVNHGILMALVRKTTSEVADASSTLPQSFIDALLSFVTFIASHSTGGNMVVGAGLIPLLIQVIDNKLPNRLPVLSKTMQLVDNILYGFTNAFNIFCTSHGVEALVNRIEYEVDLNIREHGAKTRSRDPVGSHGDLPVARSAALKHTLRSMHRMMQSSGTAEGLRGLIDLSLLKSIKKIIEHRGIFGPAVLPLAINIMATFVHNEPTSLGIIQEAGLPETFYKTIEAGLEPAIEVLQAVANALGALCLNEVGQAQLARRPSIIPGILSVFTSERHLKVLLEKENAVLIGTAIDELIRHHPSLKPAVFDAIRATITKIDGLGRAYEVPKDLRPWYRLSPIPSSTVSADGDVAMEDVESIPPASGSSTTIADTESPEEEDSQEAKSHDNHIVAFIDNLGRFLEGLFQHTAHCKDFITATDGLRLLGKLTSLPCLPYDFANSVGSDSMVQVMRTMTEVATDETLLHLAQLVRESLDDTRNFWETVEEHSKLLPLVDIAAEDEEKANYRFRDLVTLHIRITLLSDVFATAGYAHGRAAIGLLQTLMSNMSPDVVVHLGDLHRASIWENIVLNVGLTSKGITVKATPPSSPLGRTPNQSTTHLPDGDNPVNGVLNPPEAEGTPTISTATVPPKPEGPREQNSAAIKHLTHGLPSALAPFFQAMVKMLHARRNPDAAQKKQIAESSEIVAKVMVNHLSVKPSDDVLSMYAYYSIMLGFFTMLLVDERTSTHCLNTVQLFAFYRAGGFDAILTVCRAFMSTIEAIMSVRDEDRTELQKKELIHAYGGIKVALHLLHPIISSKPLFESGQTVLAVTRDKKETDPDYFEPHDFLVKLRTAVLPLLRGLWEAPWLISAPLNVIKSVVKILLELVNGEGEESKGELSTLEIGSTPPAAPPTRPPGPDQGRVQILVDMGFPRSAAERALTRTSNNLNAATDLLLSHPFPLPPDPEAEDEPPVVEPELASMPVEQPTPTTAENASDSTATSSSVDVPDAVGKTAEERRNELDEAREHLRSAFSRQALQLIDEHVSLLFELHIIFVQSNNPHRQQAVQDLVDDIKAFSPYAYDVQEQPLANRCRLLALVLSESPSLLSQETRATLMDHLLALLLSCIDHPDHPPRWLATHLLVAEALFTLAAEPRVIAIPKEGEPIVSEVIYVGPPLTEAKAIVFDFCVRLLDTPSLPGDEFLSVLRLFVLLTRDYETAMQFMKRDGLSKLLRRVKESAVAGSSSYIATILRHLIEDNQTIRHIMQHTIKRYFSQPRTRIVDVSSYVRNCSAIAFRNPEIFLEVTASLCELGQPFSSPHISLKPEPAVTEDKPTLKPETEDAAMQIDPPTMGTASASPSNGVAENVVHILIGEMIATMKAINEYPSLSSDIRPDVSSEQRPTSGSSQAALMEPGHGDTGLKTDNLPEVSKLDLYDYVCFIMQSLSELLFSYDTCKVAFLSYSSKKRSQTSAKETSKHRAATLQFLLNDLITFGTINPQPDNGARNRITLCNWAMSVVVALCVDSTPNHEAKDISPDLVSVRKFVLEAVSRAIKDPPPNEKVEARYGRLLALADLCHRLLTVRFNSTSRKQTDDNPTHVAKIMLEKNFVATLTTALSEIDLNYPNIRGLVPSILRPLEYLTKIAIKMSRASGKPKGSADDAKTESVSSIEPDDEDEEDEAVDREETPDLYRNSALGMYGGEMDDVHFTAEDEMDEEDEDEDEDVEMDFGEETGSEDTSNTESEGEEEPDEGTRGSGEVWDDGEEEEDDLVENEDDEDEDEDEGDDRHIDNEGEDEEEEMMWQDIRGEIDGVRLGGGTLDEEDEHVVPIQIIHEEDEEGDDMGSEEEDYVLENGGPAGEVFGFADSFINTSNRDGSGPFVQRRRDAVDDNFQIFGRTRQNTSTPPEATTHPLLLDTSTPNPRTTSGQPRGSRHSQRIVAGGNNAELLQTIDDLIGGGAVQLFHHIMSRRGGGAETIRLDVPAGTVVDLGRGFIQQRRAPQGLYTASVRVETPQDTPDERVGRDLEPLLTSQRWTQEVKILHGEFVTERLGKFTNHVILALLPAAVEAIKQAKVREEKELAARKEAQAAADSLAEEKAKTDLLLKKATDESTAAHTTDEASTDESRTIVPPTSEENIPPPAAGLLGIEQDQTMEDVDLAPNDTDTDMVDATTIAEDHPPLSRLTPPMDASESPPQTPAESSSAPPPPERITVMIHGSAVDITDTGIDPTFLEALPDDMREEVLNQHVRDQRAARIERPADSQISSEFLDALPPEIRAEIIQQEALQRARAPTGTAAEIDNASFIASLDPSLRQAVLMEQDEGFIQTLPSHMLAEVGAYREGQPRRSARPAIRSAPLAPHATRKSLPQHDAIQLLDKVGVAVLVRLLFFPQVLKKTLLFKVLVNLCENAKTRTELFNLLLSILQDGTGDLAAVDKSFAQMSFRNSKPVTPKTPGKQKAGAEYVPNLPLLNPQSEAVPELIVQRCLEALTFIVTSNELSSLFFLTEHELPVGLRRTASKKGKGKEKQVPQTHYPIVLLLGLLDRQSLLRTPAIMESVVGLLATVTRPLASLKDRKKPAEAEGSSSSIPAAPSAETSAPMEVTETAPSSSAPAISEVSAPPSGSILGEPQAGSALAAPVTSEKDHDKSIEAVEEKILLANPPQIPHAVLRFIVNILTVGECSGRTFQQSLALIQHLSYLPDARDVIAQELKAKAQEAGQILSSDLDELAIALEGSQGDLLVSSVASKFSPASSMQAKLLRVLKTIDYMYSPKSSPSSDTASDDVRKVQSIYESFQFSGLWRRLGGCLSVIEEKPEIEHIATVLLPLIEALMVVCKYVGSKGSAASIARALRASASPRSPTTVGESMEDLFVSFTDAHRKVLNLMVRNNPSLMSGSFALLVHNPRVLDFDNKRNYFSQQLHRRPHTREHHGTLQLNVRRARVFEDSFQHLQRKTGDQIKYGKLSVRFYDEEGVDAGGVTREWFQILARQMFDPNNALFQPCAADKLTYQPNKNSWVNPEHLSFFKFVGRVIGKAIYDGRLLDAYFARSLYRQLLGKPVDYKDVEWVDPEYYNSLCWILENDPTPLDLTFSVEGDEFGVNRIVPLKEGGETLPVTQANKREFVQLSAQYRLYSSISQQIESLLGGFYEIIPKDLITIFNEQELELLISGTPDIDVDEWRAATEYNGYTSSDPNIVWWWRALKSFNRDERAKVLSFATGTSRVPLSGFVDLQGVQGVQRFSIHKAYGASDRLPQAHTCFNQIDLPQYTSYEMLRQQLLLAINEGGEGFAFS
ncbi:E3 ubiquitin-protein ligase TOM1-like [Hypsizygus marmoreus]|uniref:HECT-type E3 ubiquitin transferase n=1 Tax=Hypsizygus marmoreus TaxID=39966 RepID=A0A369J8P1_HYPMA|nr:E3 ubiquitin-protein ligase TOM1-like [Hypsizygus marmoreus]